MTRPSDSPSEGPISNRELRTIWASGASPFDIHQQTGIPLGEIYSRLQEIQQQIVAEAEVESHEKDNIII